MRYDPDTKYKVYENASPFLWWKPLFILRLILQCTIYSNGIKSAVLVGHPNYYKPGKWIKATSVQT